MSSDPEQIRQQIEQTRNELSSDVDALTDRVNPRRLAGDRVDQARGAFSRMKEKVMGRQDGHGAGQRMSHATDSMRQKGGQATDSMRHMGGQATDSMRNMGNQAGQRMSSAADSVRNEARSLGQQSREQAHGNPLAVGLIAFGAGLLISSLIPPTRQERQLAGQARDMVGGHSDQLRQQVRHQATQVGQNIGKDMRGFAQDAARSVGSSAVKGLSAIGQEGRSAAHDVGGQAREAAGELRR
ncbi:DUF3618 domain-containing protein [Micromonospora sp. URMC 103]|uniref:DUF3618 domain-containing protein n=1 Tax=Micromonospora sp. URMC 103 TaxID=3423406 RepID=UPI003F1AB95B